MRGGDEATSAVVATAILVAVAVIAAAALLVSTSTIRGDGVAAPAIVISPTSATCDSTVTVISTSGPVPIEHLKIQPLGGEGAYAITLANRATTDAPWQGAAGDGVLLAGTEFRVWASEPLRQFVVIDVPTNTIVARFAGPSNGADSTPPAATLTSPLSLITLSGSINDACSGAASAIVEIFDNTDSVSFAGPLTANLASPGSKSTTWSLDVSSLDFTLGHSYTAAVVPTDSAGNTGPPTSVTQVAAPTITNYTSDPPSGAFVAGPGADGSMPDASGNTQHAGDSLAAPTVGLANDWTNGQASPFTLTYDATTGLVDWTISSTTIQYTSAATPWLLTTLELRLVAPGSGRAAITGMTLDGAPLYDATATNGGTFVSLIPTESLMDGFTLTGQATLSWTGAPPPGLKFEIIAGS